MIDGGQRVRCIGNGLESSRAPVPNFEIFIEGQSRLFQDHRLMQGLRAWPLSSCFGEAEQMSSAVSSSAALTV